MSSARCAAAAACILGSIGMTSAFAGVGWASGRRVQPPSAARQAGAVGNAALNNGARVAPLHTASTARGGGAAASTPLRMVAAEPVLKPTSKSASPRLAKVFGDVADDKQAAFIPYLTAGYPKRDDTVELLLALQEGGADVIELGVPFTDPQADGATIQATNQIALKNKVTLGDCLDYVRDARAKGLTAPVVLMGYLNPFLAYGLDKLMKDAQEAGADGFVVVDLLPDEAHDFVTKCRANELSFVPLVSPTTTDDRMPYVASAADSFVYCVSVAGVTGARSGLPADLKDFVGRVRAATDKPLSVGFGISSKEQVQEVAGIADGVVVGSAFMNAVDEVAADAPASEIAAHLKKFTEGLKAGITSAEMSFEHTGEQGLAYEGKDVSGGYFGDFGGRYIPETLVEAHRELEEAYEAAKADPAFHEEVAWYRREYIGGPTPMYHAKRLTEEMGGAQIWLKREELSHTGAHKINNAVGQALLAKRIGKNRIIAETGAGQHGVATATVCALLGMECIIYMGAVDCERQKLNVFRMKMLGAKVVPVESGSRTLKDAINEAMRDWVTNVVDTHYLIGSAIGPHPFPTIVRDFQAVIGKEARSQIVEMAGKLPDYVVACVGGGSNAIGMFHPFVGDVDAGDVKLVGVEAGGKGMDALNSATLTQGSPGVLHGTRTYLLQDKDGQIPETHSISAGLDYPGVGPEHSWLKDSGRAEYAAVTDVQALEALQLLARTEGLISALEPSHAVYHAMQV
ncbi:unnamed protein product, partial [Ectocarpus fasciculatus]